VRARAESLLLSMYGMVAVVVVVVFVLGEDV